jgi:hypothetical protein
MPLQLREPGIYQGTIKRWGLTKARTGTVQFYFAAVVDHKAKDNDDPAQGWDATDKAFPVSVYMPITANTIGRVIDELKSIGFTSTSPMDLDPKSPTAHDFQGTGVKLSMEHDEYQGKTRERWRISRRIGSNPLDDEARETFLNLFGEEFKDQMSKTPEDATKEIAKALAGIPF